MPRIKTMTPVENSGLNTDTSEAIFDQIARFAGYGFNKSHAAAYAAISFQTAYLKAHHPEAFFAAAMNLHLDKVDEIATFMSDLAKRKVAIWQPSINQSRARFEPLKLKKKWHGRDFGICYALSAIRGVGIQAAEAIEAERIKAGAYRDVGDFISRVGSEVNKTALMALAKSGAFDCFKIGRAEAIAEVEGQRIRGPINQLSMFETMEAAPDVAIKPLTTDEFLDNELDVLGHYMSSHPLDALKGDLFQENLYFSEFVLETSKRNMRKASMPAVVIATDVRRTNSGSLMAVLTLSDPDGTYEALAFDETWDQIRHLMKKKSRVIFNMDVSLRGDEKRLFVESASPMKLKEAVAA